MSPFGPNKRATLLIPSGPDHDLNRKHLFILLTNSIPDADTGADKVLLVSVSSVPTNGSYYDDTCVIKAGQHDFIVRDSFVFYAKARIEETNTLMRGIANRTFIAKPLLDLSVMDQVCQGLYYSKHVTPIIQNFYQRACDLSIDQ
jgi:hypothetical protein